MNKFKLSLFIYFSLILSLNANVNEFLYYLQEKDKNELLKVGVLENQGFDLSNVKLAPKNLDLKKLANANFRSNMMVENIMIIDNNYVKLQKDEQYSRIASILRNVSTLKGIQYFSPSRKEYRLLFKEFYRIKNIESDEKIPDPKLKSYKDSEIIYVFQEDLTFGENKQEVSFSFIDNKEYSSLVTRMQLKTPMKKFFFTIVPKDELISLNFVYVLDEKIVIYLVSIANTVNIAGTNSRKYESFQARLSAMGEFLKKNFQ